MQIEVAKHDDATIVRPTGDRLDIEVAADFRAKLLSLIDQGNRLSIVPGLARWCPR
jgi:anti-anti-sigma regulatory factor